MVAQRQKTINLAKDLAASQREVQRDREMSMRWHCPCPQKHRLKCGWRLVLFGA